MSKNSEIGWTHHTANPWWGCTKISPACDHCYANKFSDRLSESLLGERVVWGPGGTQVHKMDEVERDAREWDKAAAKLGERHRVFCGSMCDIFEGRKDQEASLDRLWPLIGQTKNLDWLLLSKRPNLGKRLIPAGIGLHNIWVGATVENQEWADKRLPHLLQIPAAVRFVSAEPLLGPVNLAPYLGQGDGKINWVIVGGESGGGARGCIEMLEWYRRLRGQCVRAGVPIFFKQWGRFAQGQTPHTHDKLYKLGRKNPDNRLDGLLWENYPDGTSLPARPATTKWDLIMKGAKEVFGKAS